MLLSQMNEVHSKRSAVNCQTHCICSAKIIYYASRLRWCSELLVHCNPCKLDANKQQPRVLLRQLFVGLMKIDGENYATSMIAKTK